MYYKLNEREKKFIEKIEKELLVKIEKYEDFIEIEKIIDLIYELYNELDYVKEQFEDFKNDVEDNYKRITVEEQIEGS